MTLLITGAMGNVGRRVMKAHPDAIGLDRVAGTDITCDLAQSSDLSAQLDAILPRVNAVVHLATVANPEAPEDDHFNAIIGSTRLVQAAARHSVKKLVLASSDWAEPKGGMYINAYGYSKRVMEDLAAMYRLNADRHAIALRIGWVPRNKSELVGAEDWLVANYWDDTHLLREIANALR